MSARERAFLALALIGLAAPFMPMPGEYAARIAIDYRRPGMAAPRHFALRTEASICAIMRATLSFGDPAKASFTRVGCAIP